MDYYEGLIKNTEFLTTTELAEKLKMNVQVITRKVQSGEIFAYKIGKDWRIPEQSVFEWLESHSNIDKKSKKQTKTAPAQTAKTSVTPLPEQSGQRKHFLEYILAQFEPNRIYSEEEVNRIISRHHGDHSAVRKEFIAQKMMESNNGNFRRNLAYRLSD